MVLPFAVGKLCFHIFAAKESVDVYILQPKGNQHGDGCLVVGRPPQTKIWWAVFEGTSQLWVFRNTKRSIAPFRGSPKRTQTAVGNQGAFATVRNQMGSFSGGVPTLFDNAPRLKIPQCLPEKGIWNDPCFKGWGSLKRRLNAPGT